MNLTNRKSIRRRNFGRWMVWPLVILSLAIAATMSAVPQVASSDRFRDRILNGVVSDARLQVSSESASFTWTEPVRVHGLRIFSPEKQLDIRAEEVQFDLTWWQLWMSPDQLGHVHIVRPTADVHLDWKNFDGYEAGFLPEFSASVTDANLRVDLERMQDPVIDIQNVDLSFRVEQDGAHEDLLIDAPIVLDRRALTKHQCSELLHLMDPILSDVVSVQGNYRLEIDKLRLPLNIELDDHRRELTLHGRLHLEDVVTSATTPLIRGIVRVAADLNGREPTEFVRVVNQSTIELQVRDGRLHHSGLEFGFPDIATDLIVRSEGSVGLDETLDMTVIVPQSFFVFAESAERGDDAAKLRISGTISQPKVNRVDEMEEINE